MLKFFLFILFLLTRFNSVSAAEENSYFQGMNGCFLLYNVKTATFEKVIGEERCKERFPACSTFKVPLSVMAFDSGILKDENEVLKWDGEINEREVANQDHDARSWMKDSIVWFSQRLTPQLGEEKFKAYLKAFGYGNEDLSGGITEAWLVRPDATIPALKISAYEQLEFMKKLWSGMLAVSPRAVEITKELTFLETSPGGFKLNGKTGSNFYEDKRRLGWFIAHIQKGDQEYLTVTNFSDVTPPQDGSYGGAKAKEITKQILTDEDLW